MSRHHFKKSQLAPFPLPARDCRIAAQAHPILVVPIAIVAWIALANVSKLLSSKPAIPKSSLIVRPSTVNLRQVRSYQTTQASETQRDAARPVATTPLQPAAGLASSDLLGPGSWFDRAYDATQRAAIYNDGNANAPQRTSGVSLKPMRRLSSALARAKFRHDTLNSDTLAIAFATPGGVRKSAAGQDVATEPRQPIAQPVTATVPAHPASPLAAYDFDTATEASSSVSLR